MPPDCQRCYQQAERALRLAYHKTRPGNCLDASCKAPYVAQKEPDETNDDAVSVVVLHGWLRWVGFAQRPLAGSHAVAAPAGDSRLRQRRDADITKHLRAGSSPAAVTLWVAYNRLDRLRLRSARRRYSDP